MRPRAPNSLEPGASVGTSSRTNEKPPVLPSDSGLVVGAAREPQKVTVFHPPPGTFELSFGSFGPCELKPDPDTRVAAMSCAKSGTDESEKIFLNLYLPGIWKADPFDAEGVAYFLASHNSGSPDVRVEWSFEAPDPESREPQFFLFLSVVVAEQGYGQAVMVKVAPVGGAVYSLIHSRVLHGAPSTMRTIITDWFAEHVEAYSNEVFALRPAESWVKYAKQQFNRTAPPQPTPGGGLSP